MNGCDILSGTPIRYYLHPMDIPVQKRQPVTYVFVDAANIIYRDSEPKIHGRSI